MRLAPILIGILVAGLIAVWFSVNWNSAQRQETSTSRHSGSGQQMLTELPLPSSSIAHSGSGSSLANSSSSPNMTPIIRVLDGDALLMEVDGQPSRIRLVGIDAPEAGEETNIRECFGTESRIYLEKLIGTNLIRLEKDPLQPDQDSYGRLLRMAFLPDGQNLELVMVRNGYATYKAYGEKYTQYSIIRAAQTEAKKQKQGLWNPATCNGQRRRQGGAAKPPAKPAVRPVGANGTSAKAAPKSQARPTLDSNGDGKVTCADFSSPVKDAAVLQQYPRLDGDKDGVGCQ